MTRDSYDEIHIPIIDKMSINIYTSVYGGQIDLRSQNPVVEDRNVLHPKVLSLVHINHVQDVLAPGRVLHHTFLTFGTLLIDLNYLSILFLGHTNFLFFSTISISKKDSNVFLHKKVFVVLMNTV